MTLSTLAHRIDWDRFPRTHEYLGAVPTMTRQDCRACGDDLPTGHRVYVYTDRAAPRNPVVLMCAECHDLHEGGAR